MSQTVLSSVVISPGVPGTFVELVPANPSRIYLVFSSFGAGAAKVTNHETAFPGTVDGVNLPPNSMPWELFRARHGTLVEQQWLLDGGGFGSTVGIFQVIDNGINDKPIIGGDTMLSQLANRIKQLQSNKPYGPVLPAKIQEILGRVRIGGRNENSQNGY